MMRRRAIIGGLAAAVALAAASTVNSAPDNKNTSSFTAVCDGVPVLVTQIGHANGAASFVGGDVTVVKRLAATAEFTFSIEGGPTLGPFSDPFEAGSNGSGFEDRLVQCDFSLTFTDTFKASKKFIESFGLDPSLAGATVTVTGETTGTAWIVNPGS
jgi:hypothetical protein